MRWLILLLGVVVATGWIALICVAADKIEAWAKSARGQRFFNTKE